MIKLLANYMISATLIASILLVGCDSKDNKQNQGVAIVPTQNENVATENQNENIADEVVENTTQNNGYITYDEAKSIAFRHADVSESEVSFVKCELDFEKGVAEYEVDFYVGTTEYDYEIDAITGHVISYGIDLSNQTSNQATSTEYITQEQAKNIAFSHAGITETDASFIKCEFDFDKGIAEYEVEFNVGKTEYEYEINALTGDIISFEKDND